MSDYSPFPHGSADRSHYAFTDPFDEFQYDVSSGILSDRNLPPPDFITTIQMTLEENGISTSRLRFDQVTQLAQMAWEDPLIQGLWTQANGQAGQMSGAGSSVTNFMDLSSLLRSSIKDQLFNPARSSNTQAMSMVLGWLKDQGGQLNSSQQQFSDASGTNVPVPFDRRFAQSVSLDYGEGWSGETEVGVDYAMPTGTQLSSPFAGTIHLEDGGHSNWGKRAFVKLSNGWTFAIGHMSGFSVQEGQQVNPGDIIGYSGGDPADPSSGFSSGPHIEVQWMDPSGKFTNPHAIMDRIWTGVSFGSLGQSGAMGKGVQIGAFPGDDPGLDSRFPGVISTWRKYYGGPPTGQQILSVVGGLAGQTPGVGAGQTTVQALAQQVGFTAAEAQVVAAISMAESGGNAARDQYPGQNYGGIGLMQIEYEAHPDLIQKYGGISGLHDPLNNLRAAFEVFTNAGRSFSPWTTFTGGAYQQFMGQDPQTNTNGGTLDTHQIEDRIRGMQSHIPGMNNGQYFDLRSTADSISQGLFGHGTTDGIVAELWHNKVVNQSDIKAWYGMKSVNDIMNTPAYNQIYQANQGTMWGVYNEKGFDPRIAAAQYQQQQAKQPSPPPPHDPQTPSGLPLPGKGKGAF